MIEKSLNGRDFTKVGTTVAGNVQPTATYQWNDINAVEGEHFYRICSIDLNGDKHYSQVVKVTISNKTGGGLKIYPNPVKNGIVNLIFSGMADGNYTAQILSSSGALLLSKQLTVSGTNSTQTIQPGNKLPAGVYLLEIIHPDKTKTIEQLIIGR